MSDLARQTWSELDPAMRRSLELSWESAVAGSFGVGAVATDGDGHVLATGRNRLHETEPGPDVLAGSSLAHAEMNVLAKLRYWQHEDDDVQLFTTLQPCVQCLAAIRLSPVRRVHALAPDPLWRGIEKMVDLTPFMAARWPDIIELPVTPWSVFALLVPTIRTVSRGSVGRAWTDALPLLTQLGLDVESEGRLGRLAGDGAAVTDVADSLWDELSAAVDEVAALASPIA